MITNKNDTKENKSAIWFSSILRWCLGLLFLVMGYIYSKDESSWAMMVFGILFLFTGFIRPKRCIDEKSKV